MSNSSPSTGASSVSQLRHRSVFLLGGLGGALLSAALLLAVSRLHTHAEAAPRPFSVEASAVHLQPGAPQPIHFETAVAELGAPLPLVPVTGRVSTVENLTAPSFAPLSGRVADVKVRIGSHVKQGDKLVEVRTADLAAMQREQRAAELAVRTKQAIVDRLAQLVESRAASANDLMVARSELEDAKFAAQAARARIQGLTVAQAGETSYWVIANRSGVVVQLDAQPGKQVGPDSDKPIATVADLDEVLVLADVHPNDAAFLRAGLDASVFIPGNAAPAVVDKIETVADVVDSERQTVPVRVHARNPNHVLRPNAHVDVVFSPAGPDKVLQVPAAAVVTDGDLAVVFVEAEPGKLQRRVVQLGRQTKDRAEILSGLQPGEKVVTRGALLLLNAINIQG